ncbi:hypothetical protein QBC41DRAFT_329876 [Cercophora samala]|uniref:Uncharacterized protein n=1 Tax=Cercophora samala TaxID=330535 RepID=A0AA40D569_9PEZI|nr:hypothetical protein QBC41DRAFT_329876 [Cercophora samala]
MSDRPITRQEIDALRDLEIRTRLSQRFASLITGEPFDARDEFVKRTRDEENEQELRAKRAKIEAEEVTRRTLDTSVRWMRIFNGATGNFRPFPVLLDTGSRPTGGNLVADWWARDLSLPIEDANPPRRWITITGAPAYFDKQVKLIWKDKNDVLRKTICYVVFNSPEDHLRAPLFGNEFTLEHGDNLLPLDQDDLIAYTAQANPKEIELIRIQEEERRVEEEEREERERRRQEDERKERRRRERERRRRNAGREGRIGR